LNYRRTRQSVRLAVLNSQEEKLLSHAALRELRLYHRALGDVTRLRIVHLLATEGEHTVGTLMRSLRVSGPLMSWHLHRLQRAGLVRLERSGREVRCHFQRERFLELQRRDFRILMNRGEANVG
jgi:DNA-binding transcriptional ArsR family regulator